MYNFLKKLPKLELHAHLNGSLGIASIRELSAQLYGDNTKEFLQLCEQFIDFDGLTLNSCFQKFKFMHDLTTTQRGLKLATELVIRDFSADHVVYLELRTTPKANEHMSKRQYLCTVLEAIKGAQVSHSDISVKLIPSIDRSQPPESAAETLELVLELLADYPNIITGIDLSGNPMCGEFSSFREILEKARNQGLKLALHCAENDNPKETEEMLAFGMDRCGHGTFLTADQLRSLGERNVPVECCLTSNVKCATVKTYADHHFQHLLQAKTPVVLCTDDCGVFDTTLSNELSIAVETFGLKDSDLYSLMNHAVDHAFTSEEEKKSLREKISAYFRDNKIL